MTDIAGAPTTVPMTLPDPPVEGAVRVTVGVRQGWKLPDRSVVWDDGEREMPLSGKSDAEKRAEALAQALGTLPPLHAGAPAGEIEGLRTRAAMTADPAVNERRKSAAKAISAKPPGSSEARPEKPLPMSAEEAAQALRIEARTLVGLEVARVEQLKELAIGNAVTVGRDGAPATGNVAQRLHDAILAALSAVERGDLAHTAQALAELKRWSAIGGPA